MIRNELKKDPTSFMSKHLNGIDLKPIEQLYLIHKCPHLFKFIIEPNKLTQRLYVRRVDIEKLSIDNISDRKSINIALKRNPRLCISLSIHSFEKEISKCVDALYNEGNILDLEIILSRPDINNNILRKIIFLVPSLIEAAIFAGFRDFDEDIEIYIYRSNKALIRKMINISDNALNRIIKDGFDNLYLVDKWISRISDDIILDVLERDLYKFRNNEYNLGYLIGIINAKPELFSKIIQILYKNGFGRRTSFILRFLLTEFNELIDDQLASFIIENESL